MADFWLDGATFNHLEPIPSDGARLAVFQGRSHADVMDNAIHAVETIHGVAYAGVSLVVFPELYLHGYQHPDLMSRGEELFANDQVMLRMVGEAAASSSVAVVMGYAERPVGEGDVYNSARVWHADGSVACDYRKVRLFGNEKNHFMPGTQDQWRAFQLRLRDREVRAGVCICFDTDDLTGAPRRLAADGAEILFVPCAAQTTGIWSGFGVAGDEAAARNNMIVMRANMIGAKMGGQSSIAGKDGCILHPLSIDRTELMMKSERLGSPLKMEPPIACSEHGEDSPPMYTLLAPFGIFGVALLLGVWFG